MKIRICNEIHTTFLLNILLKLENGCAMKVCSCCSLASLISIKIRSDENQRIKNLLLATTVLARRRRRRRGFITAEGLAAP